MMKKILLSLVLGMGALGMFSHAAQVVKNGAEAKKLVKDDGYVFFLYADGWDEYSRKCCETLMTHEAVLKAAGDAVLVPLPYPENPNEARKEQQKQLLDGLDVPTPWSFPALVLLDKEGKYYATIYGTPVARAKADQVAELLSDRIKKGKERRRLLVESANAAAPAQKSRLLYQAYQLDGLSWANDLGAQLAKVDPQDESGAQRALRFNAYDFAGNIGKNGMAAGLEEAEKMLADDAYSATQKQRICAAVVGMMRRDAGLKDADTMKKYIRRMRDYAPETAEGQAASLIMRDWVPGLSYGKGWSPNCIPLTKETMQMEGKLPITDTGTYLVTFKYEWGGAGLVVFGVELYDGDTKVAEDMHEGFAGNNSNNNVYRLSVPKKLNKPKLMITLGQDNRDTYGKITIEKE